MSRLSVTYHVRGDAASIEARAAAIAVEQSVEMPLDAIADAGILRDIVGEVQAIREAEPGLFEVRIGLAVDTTGYEAGQLLNMLFGNSSIQPDVTLVDAEIPEAMAEAFGGPNVGTEGLREKVGAGARALTCTALKPQGLSPDELAALAARLAGGGIDFIKDDHGLADQIYSPFADRVRAVASALRETNAKTGFRTLYAPNVSGSFDQAADQIALAEAEGIEAVLIEPMLIGVSNFHRLTRLFPNVAFIAHPAMAGAARIAPPFLLGTLFRLFGADVTIYPNYGGRFSYSPETCRAIAETARRPWADLKPCCPSPAGGMTLQRVDELLDFYGADTMLLIGGSLLAARERMTEEAAAFQARVVRHFEGLHE
ncbi:ribulose bisphosphate carboxylase large chain [Rhodomicrobium vannielii ATCC 17100]|jgi:ribulose-bisphosphate carboxylase large chain|uniref:Ribulose bisphosphate carboxylase large chain n=1 Tax=Rhodomicrobium vannielii (strain ATCC 17100 / DSM 162 / LMG 4299 / NCIMB 10020 / ATH 3.1.1) TaxID=648757 RepID=E3I6C1_RHOVT|nr:RuBisCO large subunit C-terminal-like domain-containing protein [Rhodomicrobium vannielii]ADP69482.1 ribulose bisphosphate carboxylase large chain [Rhodomicrobium vannielii ATCC 17100]